MAFLNPSILLSIYEEAGEIVDLLGETRRAGIIVAIATATLFYVFARRPHGSTLMSDIVRTVSTTQANRFATDQISDIKDASWYPFCRKLTSTSGSQVKDRYYSK